mgnify:CR=1 FL=1
METEGTHTCCNHQCVFGKVLAKVHNRILQIAAACLALATRAMFMDVFRRTDSVVPQILLLARPTALNVAIAMELAEGRRMNPAAAMETIAILRNDMLDHSFSDKVDQCHVSACGDRN